MHGYGMGALKFVYCQAKGLINRMALMEILLNLKGNNFGVSGYISVDLFSIVFELSLKLLEVIDIAVEAGMNDAAFWPLVASGVIVDRMTVCLGDGAHRRPTGVGGYRFK